MFLESFRITGVAVAQTFLIAAIGFFLVKRKFFGDDAIDTLSRLVVEVTLPILIFCQLIKGFNFSLYPYWWAFPLLSIIITIAGFLLGCPFSGFIKGHQHKWQFLSLVTFQNSGYLPLALITALLPADKADSMLIYLFLFLLGFNLVIWSLGPYMLSFHMNRKFELGSLFSPPVIAALAGLLVVSAGLDKFIPLVALKPLRMIGDCTFPLAMLVVGSSLAAIRLGHVDKKAICLIALVKLVVLPVLGLLLIVKFKFPELLGLLIIMELAMPPATSLSLIIRHYKKEDLLINQGIFFGHLISIFTLPIFLSLYFTLAMLK